MVHACHQSLVPPSFAPELADTETMEVGLLSLASAASLPSVSTVLLFERHDVADVDIPMAAAEDDAVSLTSEGCPIPPRRSGRSHVTKGHELAVHINPDQPVDNALRTTRAQIDSIDHATRGGIVHSRPRETSDYCSRTKKRKLTMKRSVELEQDEELKTEEDKEDDESDDACDIDIKKAILSRSSWNALQAHSDASIYEFNRGQSVTICSV